LEGGIGALAPEAAWGVPEIAGLKSGERSIFLKEFDEWAGYSFYLKQGIGLGLETFN